MKRISLQERLSRVPPNEDIHPKVLQDMTLGMFIDVMKRLIPERADILSRLDRCVKDGKQPDMWLDELIDMTAASNTPENNQFLYDILIGPFVAMARR